MKRLCKQSSIFFAICMLLCSAACSTQNETLSQTTQMQSTSTASISTETTPTTMLSPATISPTAPTIPMQPTMHIFWPMYASLVTPDGQATESFLVQVDGDIIFSSDGGKYLSFEIQTPDTYRYAYTKPDYGSPACISGKTDGLPYYVWIAYSFERPAADFCWGSYALCTEKQYLIMSWDDDEELYLVASLDETIGPSAILSYFQGFIDLYAFEN